MNEINTHLAVWDIAKKICDKVIVTIQIAAVPNTDKSVWYNFTNKNIFYSILCIILNEISILEFKNLALNKSECFS